MATTFQYQLALATASANNIATSQSPGSGGITLGGTTVSGGVATLDTARRILFTSGGNDSGITFTVNGTNLAGNALSETITGGNTTAFTTQDFKTVSSVTHTGSVASTLTIGTNGVASSPWFIVDRDVNPFALGVAVTVSGTINYTVEYTYDDPNSVFSTTTFPTLFNQTVLLTKTATLDGGGTFNFPVFAIRLTQNSFTHPATAAVQFVQPVLTPT